jgi:hypothetical protein
VDNNWSNPNNWDLARVPETSDSVVINVAGQDTVNVNTNTTMAHLVVGSVGGVLLNHTSGSTLHVTTTGSIGPSSTLEMSGSSVLTGSGTVAVEGTLNWNGGTMSGSGATELTTTGTADIAASAGVTLNTRALRIGGVASLGTGNISGVNAPTISVLSGGTLEFSATRNYVVSTGLVSLANAGTLRKGASAGRINVEWPILNNGGVLEIVDDTLDVQGNLVHAAGTIAINAGAALIARGETLADGAVTIGTGGRMQLQSGGISANNGNHIFSPTSSITGGGWLQINSADTTRIQGALNIDSLTVQNGNTWFESADTMIVNNGAYLGGGFFRGNGVIRYDGNFVLNSGNIVGTGRMHVAPTGSLALRGMTGWFVDVEGTATWGDYDMTFGQDTLNGVPYSSVRVRSGALLDIQHGVTTPRELFGRGANEPQTSVIQIDGGATLRKSVGTGISNIRPRVLLSGEINVLDGTINVQGTCTVTGGTLSGTGQLTGNCPLP